MTTAALLSFVLATILVRLLAVTHFAQRIVDVPNERSLHARPVPRMGGLGLLLAAGITWALLSGGALAVPVAIAASLAALSFVDDVKSLPVQTRLIAHGLAGVALLAAFTPEPWAVLPLALLAIVWMTNLFNFMDGSDGLAGGMAAIGFGAYAIAAAEARADNLALLAAPVAGAAAGFLISNFPPARIFMGDVGSIPLGFLAAGLGMIGWERALWPLWFPPLVFSPFIVDATATLITRLVRRERLSEAHKTHYYQRLHRMGFGHRGTALAEYALMAAVAATALIGRDWEPRGALALLVAWCATYLFLMYAIDRRWHAFETRSSA